ncbi:MAG: glycerate kinase [Ilumatobacteraceae bacterium]
MRVVAAVDKFRGTATAAEVATAIGHACWSEGHDCVEIPLADGGEGSLAVLGGANRTQRVTGPLGKPVDAQWRFHRGVAVIEMATAAGLTLAGGAQRNDPINATTTGVGELIDSALNLGAKKIIVCVGGSATTDGGWGAVQAITAPARLKGVEFVVACDVDTAFLDAARIFAPQKGATATQIDFLESRLARTAQLYRDNFDVDVTTIPGAGAAGGLAGGLAALGAQLVSGFDVIADEVDLYDALDACDLVITGEGKLDAESFRGKVVGGVASLAAKRGIPCVAICGDVDPDAARDFVRSLAASTKQAASTQFSAVSLVEKFGHELALGQPRTCIEDAAAEVLRAVAR